MPPLLTYLSYWGCSSFLSPSTPSSAPGLEPGLATNSFDQPFTELDPSIIEKFERQFTLDKQALASKLSSVINHHRRSEGATIHARIKWGLEPKTDLEKPIDVYVHVISADSSAANGNVLLSQVREQIDVLNGAFVTPAGRPYLSFNLAAVDRTVNADWFNNGGPGTLQATARYDENCPPKGGRADLNIYTVKTLPLPPHIPSSKSSLHSFQGEPPQATTGADDHPRNGALGRLVPHVPGQLYWTRRLCRGHNAEGIPSQGCMQGRATCPLADAAQEETGPDTTDACMTEFTLGRWIGEQQL
ncbi:hypothetical protein FA13DRAFT_1844914, partial [Coprinellus micaceus]